MPFLMQNLRRLQETETAGALQMYSGIDNECKNLSVTATLIYEIRYMYKLQINFVFAQVPVFINRNVFIRALMFYLIYVNHFTRTPCISYSLPFVDILL